MSNKVDVFPQKQKVSVATIHARTLISWGKTALFFLALIIMAIPFIFPFIWMFTSSFKGLSEIFAPALFPSTWQWRNYIEVFNFQPFGRHFFNSLYISSVVTLGTIFFSSLAGYGFARIKFRGNSFFFLLLLSSLIMPAEVTIIPNFRLMQILGWIDTHIPLIIIPILGANGIISTFIMRQFFLSFPVEIEEAAMIDGLNRFGIFWRIAMPMARSAVAAVAILTFLFSWNSFLEPLIYVDKLELFTLPLSLRNFTDSYGVPLWNLQLAGATLSVVPILLVFILAQRQVVNSLASSGVKG